MFQILETHELENLDPEKKIFTEGNEGKQRKNAPGLNLRYPSFPSVNTVSVSRVWKNYE